MREIGSRAIRTLFDAIGQLLKNCVNPTRTIHKTVLRAHGG